MPIILDNPFGALCQFTSEGPTLGECLDVPDVYPAARLDKDPEDLLLLTDDGKLQAQVALPKHRLPKAYRLLVARFFRVRLAPD